MNKNLHIAKNEAFKGEIYLICEMLLWGMFPVFSKLAFLSIPPLYTAGLSTLIAAGFFALVLTIRKEWKEIKIKSAWKDTLLASFIIGFVFYTLAFIGMEKTSAGNASIISLTEAFFAMFIFSLWKKEHMIFKHKIGAILMIVGAGIILFPGKIQINHGDIFILTAAAIAPFGNYFAQRARKKIGSIMIMFIRSIFAGICLLMLALIFEQKPSAQAITTSMIFILVNGTLLMGLSKVFWIEALHRLSVTKTTSFNSLTAGVTLLTAYFFLGEIPTIWQILGLIPLFAGTILLTAYKLQKKF